MLHAFQHADYTWVFISMLLGWLSHMSRAYRWKYLLEPIGSKPTHWLSYHSVMIGYIINLALPRAGEPARAAYLAKRTSVPFEKVFGTIFAERIIDLVMLAIIGSTALVLHYDKLDDFMAIAGSFGSETEDGTSWLTWVVYGLVGLVVVVVLFLYLTNTKFNTKIKELVKGFAEGLKTIFTMPNKWAFLGHTLFIWLMYLAMFGICFWSLPETTEVPVSGILAGFVAGTIGIIVIQGGIGIYPVLVGIVVTLFLGVPEGSDSANLLNPTGTALGWIIWTSQTILVVLLGALSLLLIPKVKKDGEPVTTITQ